MPPFDSLPGSVPSDLSRDSESTPIDARHRDGGDVAARSFASLLQRRITRRGFLRAAAVGAGASLALSSQPLAALTLQDPNGPSTLTFDEVENITTETHAVAAGHRADVLARWGDPVLDNAPAFDPHALSPEAQARQFGYNNDFLAYLPLGRGAEASSHGLLCVNHEYTNCDLMWDGAVWRGPLDALQTAVEISAHGHSVLEVRRDPDAGWAIVPGSEFARRITARTPMRMAGPAAGHPRLRTHADPTGKHVLGTISNCGGGVTPWGTVLIAEENFNTYFLGDPPKCPDTRERANHARYGIGRPLYRWGDHEQRFDIEREPREANRFGWLVEIDPHDPLAIPIKRSALGRFKHEAAGIVQNPDGRVIVYSGDDQAFEYVYKFVSHGRVDSRNRDANRALLDCGVLFVARFEDDGTGRWLPLVFGTGPLTPDNGFASQADVLIEARRAADLLGATPMDRPEDVEVHPRTGSVFVMLTKNSARTQAQVDGPNPRATNRYGHIVELVPPKDTRGGTDHGTLRFSWSVLLRGGNPDIQAHAAAYHSDTSKNGWLIAPDNCAFDPAGRLWIATDQGATQDENGIPDGIRACDVDGPGRALTKLFFRGPRNAEVTGPCFTPDGTTLFVSVQHPGEASHSNFADPSTRWPDFQDDMPPRPSVVAITREDGGPIG